MVRALGAAHPDAKAYLEDLVMVNKARKEKAALNVVVGSSGSSSVSRSAAASGIIVPMLV